MYAATKSLESLPEEVQHCRVDVHVGLQVAIHASPGRASRSWELTQAVKRIFVFVTQRNLVLTMSYVLSDSIPADWFSRNLSKSDAMLSPSFWELVESEFGGEEGHYLDLMSLDSNSQRIKCGNPFRKFIPHPSPDSSGFNVFNQDFAVCDGIRVKTYAFSPFSALFPPSSEGTNVTVGVPKQFPLPSW